jgi:hypothetical protein
MPYNGQPVSAGRFKKISFGLLFSSLRVKLTVCSDASLAFTGLLGWRCERLQLGQALADSIHQPVL